MNKKELQKYALKSSISKSDFDLIVMKNLSISKSELFLLDEIEEKYIKDIKKDLEKRKNGTPIEYILEKAEFFSLDFFVDNRVLIPRNDTEIMVKEVLTEISEKHRNLLLVDIGTGSSAIPISILKNSNIQNALAIDISEKALEVAKINIKKHKLENYIQTLQSDLLTEILKKENNLKKYFNDFEPISKNIIITANLPYIKNSDFKNMSPETLKFEPNLALFGGKDTGFELYEKLIGQILELKNKNIILFIEIGFNQKEIAKNFLNKLNLKFKIYKDNSKIDRCIKIFFDF